MQTLYIDVYFLINFTVDILAIYVASRLAHVRLSAARLILCGAVGAIFAILTLFLKSNAVIYGLLWIALLLLLSAIACLKASLLRKIKFLMLFFIAAFFISGAVNFVYGLIDRYCKDFFEELESGGENRRVLLFSLIILVIIGVFRIILMVFSNSMAEKSVMLNILLDGRQAQVEALVDSGNLVKDPMSMCPVIFINKRVACEILPCEALELSMLDRLDDGLKRRIRLIPVTRGDETHVMIGVRADEITYTSGKSSEVLDATVVIDKEGTYGGYDALAPYVALGNA